ncbi:MAG: hypothetical protein II943_03795 [Victivallales bacterium]|nr:hypothetical protein [Victivallales bacterium]
MLLYVVMLLAAADAAIFTYSAGEGGHWGWAIPAALGAAIVASLPLSWWVKKRIEAIFNRVQEMLLRDQQTMQRKVAALQNKGVGGQKVVSQLEKEQETSVRAALVPLEELKPYQWLNPLVKKQADMLKGQLLFQIKDYDAARPCLENAMVLDPSIACMQMILHWKKDPEETKELDKMFNKGVGRFKYDKGTLIYALYSWILVKQNRLNEAVSVLAEGKTKTEDPVIAQNWDHLANNRLKRLSFAGLGERWYALGLETPQPVRQQQQAPFGGRVSRRGFR